MATAASQPNAPESFEDYLTRALSYQPFRGGAMPRSNSGMIGAIRAQSTWNAENPSGVYVMSHPLVRLMTHGAHAMMRSKKGDTAMIKRQDAVSPTLGGTAGGGNNDIGNVGQFGTPGSLPSGPGADSGPSLFGDSPAGNFTPVSDPEPPALQPVDDSGPLSGDGHDWTGGWTGSGVPHADITGFGYNPNSGNAPPTEVPTYWGPGNGNEPVEGRPVSADELFGNDNDGGFTKDTGDGSDGGLTKPNDAGPASGGGYPSVPDLRSGNKRYRAN